MRSRVRNVSLQTLPGNKEAILHSDGTLPPSPFQYSCVIMATANQEEFLFYPVWEGGHTEGRIGK